MIQNLGWLYLVALLFSLGGLTTLDWRFGLAFFRDAQTSTRQLLVSLLAFVIIDYLALASGAFVEGTSDFETGIFLPGRLPIEEPLFLLLLVYSAMLLAAAFARRKPKR